MGRAPQHPSAFLWLSAFERSLPLRRVNRFPVEKALTMNEHSDRLYTLKKQFPRVLQNANLPWGLECGPGWDGLLADLLFRIDTILTEYPACTANVVQIKEKFGALRFYCQVDGDDDARQDAAAQAISRAIRHAEHVSAETCENCGQPSSIRGAGLLTTICPNCTSQRKLASKTSD